MDASSNSETVLGPSNVKKKLAGKGYLPEARIALIDDPLTISKGELHCFVLHLALTMSNPPLSAICDAISVGTSSISLLLSLPLLPISHRCGNTYPACQPFFACQPLFRSRAQKPLARSFPSSTTAASRTAPSKVIPCALQLAIGVTVLSPEQDAPLSGHIEDVLESFLVRLVVPDQASAWATRSQAGVASISADAVKAVQSECHL